MYLPYKIATYSELKRIIKSDLLKYSKDGRKRDLIKSLVMKRQFRFTLVLRLCVFFYYRKLTRYTLHIMARILLRHYHMKFGLEIPWNVKLGKGFRILHLGGIVVSQRCVIGNNFTIGHGVTLGVKWRGADAYKAPIIGDDVYLAPGSKIIGNINIGNNVAVGANAVVTKDVPDNAVVVGIPAKIISFKGSTNC